MRKKKNGFATYPPLLLLPLWLWQQSCYMKKLFFRNNGTGDRRFGSTRNVHGKPIAF